MSQVGATFAICSFSWRRARIIRRHGYFQHAHREFAACFKTPDALAFPTAPTSSYLVP
jgi:hypothetical protein